jgi:uncharacterized protein (DUF952 family)
MALIYKILRAQEWRDAQVEGVFRGSAADRADGFIHFSTARQARATAAKHFAGESGLIVAAVEAEGLGAAMRWEPSRGGDLFPHLYAELPLAAILWTRALPLGEDGAHQFPESFA